MKLQYRNEKNAKFIASFYNKTLDQPEWYKINAVSEDEAEIYIMSYVGWPYNSAEDFVKNLASMTHSKITIRINSPGGDVWDAHAIHNAIKRHKSKPTTCVESLAASAASYIAVAGHRKVAYKNAMGMIHEPMTGMWGNQFELRETADILAQVSESMVDMYADNTNVGKREIREMLKAETWMSAKIMKEKGFIDDIIEDKKGTKAEFDLSIFANLPDEFKDEGNKKILTEREIEKFLRDGGISNKKAKAILAGCRNVDGEDDTPQEQIVIVPPQPEPITIDPSIIAALKSNINKLTLSGGK